MEEAGAKHVDAVADRLDDCDRNVKVACLNAIAEFGHAGAQRAAQVAAKLNDSSLTVVKDSTAPNGVRLWDPDAPVRQAALQCLSRFHDAAIPFMTEAAARLADTDAAVREAAMELLSRMQLSLGPLRELLAASLTHTDPLVRRGAIEVVRRSGEEGAALAEALAARLEDEQPEIQLAAADVILGMGPAGEPCSTCTLLPY